MRKLLTISGCVILVITIATAALALLGGHRRGPWSHSHWGDDPAQFKAVASERLDHILDHLKATDEQRARVHVITDELFTEAAALRTHHKLREDIITQFSVEEPDAALLHSRIDEETDALRTFAHRLVDDAVELHSILTPEQRQMIAKHMKEHRHGRRWRWM